MEESLIPRYNIAPTQTVAAILMQNKHEIVGLRWGLIPSWAKTAAIGAKMINARSETVQEKASFKLAFATKRCIIPATGFYEWLRQAKLKVPHFIFMPNSPILSFAGLWEEWVDDDGDEVRSCTILTTAANEKIQALHHRMPVILNPQMEKIWLDPARQQAELLSLFQPTSSNLVDFHTVSTLVNKVGNENPQLIEKVAYRKPPKQGTLF